MPTNKQSEHEKYIAGRRAAIELIKAARALGKELRDAGEYLENFKRWNQGE